MQNIPYKPLGVACAWHMSPPDASHVTPCAWHMSPPERVMCHPLSLAHIAACACHTP